MRHWLSFFVALLLAAPVLANVPGLKASSSQHLGVRQDRRDAVGRLREQEDAKGQKVRFSYTDALGRLASREVYDHTEALASSVTNTYDTSGDGNFTVYPGQFYRTMDAEGWKQWRNHEVLGTQ